MSDPVNQDTLQVIDSSGEPVRQRVSSVQAARNIFNDCLLAQEPLSRVRARIRGIVNGNPPYDPDELKRLGQGWRTNFNAREAEAIIDANSSALWEMQHDLFVFARFRARDPNHRYSPTNGLDYGQILSEEYTQVLRDWDRWPVFTDLIIHDSMETGIGAAIWSDSKAVFPSWHNISSFVFPSKATTEVEDLDFFFLCDEIPLHRIFDIVRADPKKAKEEGWDLTVVRDYLVSLFGYGSSQTSESPEDRYRMPAWEAVQQMIRNNDPAVQTRQFEGVKIVRLFVRDLTGSSGVTQYIFTEELVQTQSPQDPSDEAVSFNDRFLFMRENQFRSMPECLWLLLYSYGDGFLSSVKGLGHRILPHCEISNRLICSTFDSGILSSSLLLQPKSGIDFSKMSILRVGPLTYIPEHVEAIQTSFNPKVEGQILLRDMSSSILNNNTGVFRARNENPLKREGNKTARQVVSEESKEARFEKNQAAYFYCQWDFLHREVFRRLIGVKGTSSVFSADVKAAEDFRSRCTSRGVPEELLDSKYWDVRAERAIGLGAPGMRLDVTAQVLSVKGMLPEENQPHAVREFLAARVGAQHVDRFFPLKPKSAYTSDASSIAYMENNDFREGSWVPAGSDQPHGIHIPIHMTPLVQIMQSFDSDPQSVDARQAMSVFAVAIPHIQEHLMYMSRDHLDTDIEREAKLKEYNDLFKKVKEFFGRLQGVADKLEQAAQKQREQEMQKIQELQQEADGRKFEVQKYEIDKKHELDVYQAQLLHQARMAKAETSIEAQVRKVLNDLQIDSLKAASEIENDRRETDAKIAKESRT